MKIVWRPARMVSHYKISSKLRDFLLDPGSTTVRFKKISDQFKVRVLLQAWQIPTVEEALILQIPRRTRTLVRAVEIYLHRELWMVCRAVFPMRTLTGKWRRLIDELDERPLGQLLFCNPRLQRSEYEVAYLEAQKIWARRSLFYLAENKPLLLTECLMPRLIKYYS